jgi:hypothetical protein
MLLLGWMNPERVGLTFLLCVTKRLLWVTQPAEPACSGGQAAQASHASPSPPLPPFPATAQDRQSLLPL